MLGWVYPGQIYPAGVPLLGPSIPVNLPGTADPVFGTPWDSITGQAFFGITGTAFEAVTGAPWYGVTGKAWENVTE